MRVVPQAREELRGFPRAAQVLEDPGQDLLGVPAVTGHPDPLGQTGVYATGESADCVADPDVCEPVPMEQTKILFGPLESTDPPPDPTKKSDSRPAAP